MGRRALSTHIREGSPLAAEYDRFLEMQGFESNSEAMRHLIREGVRPYSRFQVYLPVGSVAAGGTKRMGGHHYRGMPGDRWRWLHDHLESQVCRHRYWGRVAAAPPW
jgi:hypothetical protein